MTQENSYRTFIAGFAKELGYSKQRAEEQWDAFSRDLDEGARQQIEAGGFDSGCSLAQEYAAMFDDVRDDK